VNKLFVTIAIAMGALTIVVVSAYFVLFAPPDYTGTKTVFVVNSGQSIADVINSLFEEQFVRSRLGAKIAFKLSRVRVVQANIYDVSQRMNAWQIARVIGGDEINAAKVTVPEGFTIEQIGELLHKKSIVSAEKFVDFATNYASDRDFLTARNTNSLEGYLFPDTYNFAHGVDPQNITEKMLSNFNRRISPLADDIASSRYDLHQIITLASLVEKEARNDEDRKLMAGVMLNRLNIGMKLDVDATVRYITNNWLEPIGQDDLDIDSPYNTRKYAGLPPGPICNPGLAAIEAVLRPTASRYFYYLTAPDGTSYYARTLDEHNANKAKYL